MDHWGVTCRKDFIEQVSKNSQSQILDYALMKCVPLIVRVNSYLYTTNPTYLGLDRRLGLGYVFSDPVLYWVYVDLVGSKF